MFLAMRRLNGDESPSFKPSTALIQLLKEQVICSTPDVVIRELTPDDEFIVLACT